MNKELKAAFKGSIKKWKIVVAKGTSGIGHCAMCKYVELNRPQLNCNLCPLSADSSGCCCGDLYFKYTGQPTKENAQDVLDYIQEKYKQATK